MTRTLATKAPRRARRLRDSGGAVAIRASRRCARRSETDCELCLSARTSIAKSYEIEGNWEAAVRMLRELSEFHPWSTVGMEAPLYIAKGYEERKQPEEAAGAYKRAVTVYTRLISESPSEELAWRVKGYLALAHQRLGEWDRAVAVLEELAKGPEAIRPLALLSLGTIYQTKLHEPEHAEAVYHRLFEPSQPAMGAP